LLAQKTIRDRSNRGELTEDSIYQLYLQATGDEDFAERVQAKFILEKAKQQGMEGLR